ncbi:hypothetical protein Ancab_010423 [Ancistrocladus abbreviatus]
MRLLSPSTVAFPLSVCRVLRSASLSPSSEHLQSRSTQLRLMADKRTEANPQNTIKYSPEVSRIQELLGDETVEVSVQFTYLSGTNSCDCSTPVTTCVIQNYGSEFGSGFSVLLVVKFRAVSGLLLSGDGNAFSGSSNPIPTSISNARISGSGTLDIEGTGSSFFEPSNCRTQVQSPEIQRRLPGKEELKVGK